ncbi:MAG: glycerol-3-phosphate 1-O-acyltransferase PlsY [Bacteroidota bacterium]|uniref:glycerol-3-phosphate 1-O-acyltransferase PlsY n=1 Tax=Candidatus Pollutiaquabacter sp. TaxID=3416354 RepID=UPI001A5A1E40|nr:glycerol-3-phosphate 1-O-acyltransferase PlsY [Bacteroidota bacterium]MBL7947899.1 glycerol-3-phosphate 1-O-acyltransferase PlsY [Bacteroidia bacterium]MBP6009169.1 glycerol-3-phosphate 1-O-acyltransferase PlsY [Bacteroidia bacterium]MBP7269313.1 glycerol-3-phosphate 1-O-acyltransferase PlsY [Bacteroidia bacterium]MBP7437153.1 glycerol-3-phosphate 1-O-acyltransferase PlsY [Bacteroidia bacterium]
MLTPVNLFGLLLAYLVGSIPSAVWVGRTFYGIDVREYGSGNAGATNTFRVLGKKPGIVVLIMDVLKGFAGVKLAYLVGDYDPASPEFIDFELALSVCALLGHIFPVYVGFRGGKGVATMLGILVAVHTPAALICAGVFLLSLLITGYVSLSSMAAGLAFPVVIMVFYSTNSSINIFSLAVAIMILVTHQRNIERLIAGEESRVKWHPRNKIA